MKERGIYYPNGEYKSRQEIVDKLARSSEQVIFKTPITKGQGFEFWHNELTRRQEAREQAFPRENHVKIEIPTEKPVRLCFIGDVHAGGGKVDYDRFAKDIAYIRDRPNTYLITLGDLTDSFFFNPAQDEHLASREEQYEYMKAALGEVKEKLLVGFAGNHER